MTYDTPIYINGKLVKQPFWFCFEGALDDLNADIKLIPTRSDQFITLAQLTKLANVTNLDSFTDEAIYSLYSFKEGVQFLLMYLKDICDRGLLMYMLSSPFVDEEGLMELLLDQTVLENCDDSFLDHLAHNPNIYES
jgi:hypothetical protein